MRRAVEPQCGTASDRFRYGYDRNGNVMYEENVVCGTFGELYHANGASNGYDNLNRLTTFFRGTLSDANSDGIPDTISTPSACNTWSLDALGNWTSTGSQNRTFNAENEIISITGLTTPGYDNNGNTTTDETGRTFVYDAWNHIVSVTSGAATDTYVYDALGRRITESLNGTTTELYFSGAWQVIEECVGGATKAQYVWSPVYVDALVLRDSDTTTGGDLGISGSGLDQRLYVQQDANWNVTALMNTSGTVVERYAYDPYGTATYLNGDWTSRSSSAYSWKYLHQGGQWDGTSGKYAFRNRDYDPELGTWIEQDPAGYGDGSNLYQAVGSNPARAVDPMGLDSVVTSFRGTKDGRRGTYERVETYESASLLSWSRHAQYRIGPAFFTPDPDSTLAEDLAFTFALQKALSANNGRLLPGDANELPMNEAIAIRVLDSLEKEVVGNGRTRFHIETEGYWAELESKYPGKSHDEIIAIERADANVHRARLNLLLNLNEAFRVYTAVCVPTCELIIMAGALPTMLASPFRPPIGTAVTTTIVRPAVTRLGERDVVVGMIRDGKILKQVPYPTNPMLAPSHAQIAKELSVYMGPGKLAPGVEAFTVFKEGGKVVIRGSNNFNVDVSEKAAAALQEAFK